ncbi:MAG: sodium-dependent transporter, partial [Thermodesulfobacteriota bacterium]|nr:sodium-dependent transporter [Thermodesulfobacteriota bacterium]
ELAVRILMDTGVNRKSAVITVGIIGFLSGMPSAISMDFLTNQDWVWGIGLLVGGFFVVLAALKYGAARFRQELINGRGNDINLGKWYDWVIKYVIPVEFGGLIIWWFYQSAAIYDPEAWWNPFRVFSLGTCFFQWGVLLSLLVVLNRWLGQKTLGTQMMDQNGP